MRFELLGPVSVVVDGRRHSVPRAQTRGVLALLLLNTGRRQSRESIIEAVWGGAAPSTARAQLHNAVRDIRAHLTGLGGADVIVTEPFGYRAEVDPSDVDALDFQQNIERAAEAARGGRSAEAVERLRGALAQWTGEPLQDVAGAFVEPARARLVDLRLTAVEDLADLQLRHGRPELVAADLAPLVHAYPMRERLRARLMTALHLSGRRPEALRSAREYRALLADQEGLDPGPEIIDAEDTIRRAEAAAAAPKPAPPRSVPAQLPAAPGGFAGRQDELDHLDRLVDTDSSGNRIAALIGPGGAGKTALAVHWAYQRLGDFPDGQLYVDLHGFGVDPALDSTVALGQLLRGLGRADANLPRGLDERAAEYRSMLSGRRMLIVLDNAANGAQVRPLLPGIGPHFTVITSRRRLDSLAVGEGVTLIPLEPLPLADSVRLLRRHAATADDARLTEVARLTDGLPLALRIVAARLANTSPAGLAGLVADLADEQRRLATLSLPAEDTAVRSAFSTSYHGLSELGRRLFRVLGIAPSAETSVAPCATALDRPVAETAEAMEELRACHLVTATTAGRYQMHDLMRLYARELAAEDEAERLNTQGRLLDWYASVADRADTVLRPHRGEMLTGPNADPTAFSDPTEALVWFDTEAGNLLPAVAAAADRHPDTCWRLAAVLFGWLERRQRSSSWLAVYEDGLRAADAVGDRTAQAMMAQSLAIVNCFLNRFDEAAVAFERALAVRRELGQPRQAGTTLMNLGCLYVDTGRNAEGLRCFAEALVLFEGVPDNVALISAVYNNLGWAHREGGRPDDALECYKRAVEYAHDCDDDQSVAYAETNMGLVLADCERHEEAAAHWSNGVDYARRAGDLRLEAGALAGVGKAQIRLGDHRAAYQNLTAALAAYETLGDDRTAEISELIATLPPSSVA